MPIRRGIGDASCCSCGKARPLTSNRHLVRNPRSRSKSQPSIPEEDREPAIPDTISSGNTAEFPRLPLKGSAFEMVNAAVSLNFNATSEYYPR